MLDIRPEKPSEFEKILEINNLAFGQENEGKLVSLIRTSPHFIPTLSLVAEKDGELSGHILFSEVMIETSQGTTVNTIGLAPMAVKPDFQNQGIGSALVNAGLERCKELGYGHVVVLGHPEFYPRFGFEPSVKFGIKPPFPVPENVFMALELTKGALSGIEGAVRYPPAFSEVS
ncbi:N-acetyltransferase [Bacillus sp. ISL-47]|uniref:GNAT family N-acetyltransferase n=1 Tax=Bacillus sp. ISL-47 TaxID=2819130 RepID=UPI001BE6F8A1|nr:N-acetyltransferase [Bacillus sp. ISL-47]MBT2690693.1 N-acetyltransferase [Bacillus sp. ISL-47]MBT2709638.1 N-acetyltransferase [Pseudomonas sp. ISL-84]